MGIERLVLMLEQEQKVPDHARVPINAYVLAIGENTTTQAQALAESIRQKFPRQGVISHCGGGKYNNQLKKAYNSGARIAVILERDDNGAAPLTEVKLKELGDSGLTRTLPIDEVLSALGEFLAEDVG